MRADAFADRVDAATAPGPHLGRDVVDDGDSPAFQLPGQAQVEVRIVDEDGEVRTLAIHLVEHAREDSAQAPEVPQDLEQTHHRQLPHVGDEVGALRVDVVPPQAEGGDAWSQAPKVPQELAAVEIARGLTAGHEQARLFAQAAQYSLERTAECPLRGTSRPGTGKLR